MNNFVACRRSVYAKANVFQAVNEDGGGGDRIGGETRSRASSRISSRHSNQTGDHLHHYNHRERRLRANSSGNSSCLTNRPCALCKLPIHFFRQQFDCGHVMHGECSWRYAALHPHFDPDSCARCDHKRSRKCSFDSLSSNVSA